MALHARPERETAKSVAAGALTWIGGADNRATLESRARSGYVPAGIVVLVNTSLAWLAAAGALAGSPKMPIGVAIAVGLLFGLLVGVVNRAVAGRVIGNAGAFAGRAVGPLAIGAIAGELASLVVARCEYNPSPECPQSFITGVPGAGPETRTANGMLADRGLGARWVAMNSLTMAGAGTVVLRCALAAFFGFLTLLPLLLRLWRGETAQDRVLAARLRRVRVPAGSTP
ncbi:MAG: hypothetical protein QG655_694 [Actinomycetota bacterium]|nr:hypothetical protein [Actinomycetota bacterium]HPY23823.1 DUF4407 domain-containing protein [Mycobacterium sp.]